MIKNIIAKFFLPLLIIYFLIIGLMYLFQEKIIFLPEKLEKDYEFTFQAPFEEIYIPAMDGDSLHGILFKAKSSKGLIFFLHGNAGSLRRWGNIAEAYTNLNYDIFMLDYRGYGKSEGLISSEEQFYDDVQRVFNVITEKYPQDKIIILGFSIGTGPAAKLASENEVRLLILQAPYYSLIDMMEQYYPIIPTVVLKYPFETNKHLEKVDEPVVIFHGDGDKVINYNASLKLKEHFKPGDTLITLPGQGHNGFTQNKTYQKALQNILQ